MKEMTIEQKAKAYDKAIAHAKKLLKTIGNATLGNLVLKNEFETMFHELAESEDERVRQLLIRFVKYDMPDNYSDEFSKEDCLAWFEKQGEQKPVVIIPKFRVGDVIRPKGSAVEYTIESISGECYHGKGWGLHISCDNDYELVEQKSAWSEEDELQMQGIIDLLPGLTIRHNWLKHLKERVQPQSQWKPSDEQVKALWDSIPENVKEISEREMLLDSLYQDLKKLKV